MHPYFFTYICYIRLMNAVDEFIIYDNIEFTKRGWINRNRILVNGKDDFITLPLKKDSDYLDVKDRYLADVWGVESKKMLNKIKEAYRKAPYFEAAYSVMEKSIVCEEYNLFGFILNSLNLIKEYLGIKTPLIISSSVQVDHSLKSKDKVIAICKARNATVYLNPIGGLELYNKDEFESAGIKLQFHKTNEIKYSQFNNDFIPFLSIIDVIMFNSKEKIQKYLNLYKLV